MLLSKNEGQNRNLMNLGDTITAIATPLGVGGVGVIRVSGPDARAMASRFLSPSTRFKANTIRHVRLSSPFSGEPLDDGCVAFFKAPRSYTGEDVIEFHLHGSVHILKRVTQELVRLGCRMAAPGEFTRRAFVNGKLDLTKAESVIDMIHTSSDRGHAVALNHLNGGLYRRMAGIRTQLMEILEHVEGSLDFPDEIEPINRDDTMRRLSEIDRMLEHTQNQKDFGKWITSGIKCVIVGRPNAGKSSLMNRLAGEDRAIVSSIPGTTRDFITVHTELGGVRFEFIDTAGIRETDDPVELLGVKRVRSLIRQADLVVWVVDHSTAVRSEDTDILKLLRLRNGVICLNKSDKKQRCDITAINPHDRWPVCRISCRSGDGIDAFKAFLHDRFIRQLDAVDLDLMCNIRQQSCVGIVRDHLQSICRDMRVAPNDDCFAFDLRQAILHLGEITGDTFNEAVLDGIFSRFCVGK